MMKIYNLLTVRMLMKRRVFRQSDVSCMSSGVVRDGQLQTGTCHWKIRRIFQVGGDKPLLIHIVELNLKVASRDSYITIHYL